MILRTVLLLLFFLPLPLSASPCWRSIFHQNEIHRGKNRSVVILPFENASRLEEDEWIRHLFPILLEEYLSSAKKVSAEALSVAPPTPFVDPEESLDLAREAKADFLIFGQFSRSGEILNINARFFDVKKGEEKGRISGQVDFPETRKIHDFLFELALQSAKAFKKIPLSKKSLFPFKHTTASAEALRYYVLGRTALMRLTPEGVREALRRFEGSIRADYNYSFAYLGLALSLARQGFLEKAAGEAYRTSWTRARAELEKARILRPKMVEKKSDVIERYLQADTYHRLAEGYALQGKFKDAASELKKGIDLLPGDLAGLRQLVSYLQQGGRAKEAERYGEAATLLDRCGGGE